MRTEELIELLKTEKAYINNISVTMDVEGMTFMDVSLTIVPARHGVHSVKLMGLKKHEENEKKLVKMIEDDLFKL